MTNYRHGNYKTGKERERQTDTTTTNYSTTINTEPGVLSPIQLEAIRTAYVDVIGPLNMYRAQIIEQAMATGLDAGAILDAIEQTAMAPRPSHAYLAAILRRYIAAGITTAAAAMADRQRHAVRRAAAGREASPWYARPSAHNPALDYAQRDNSTYDNWAGYIDLDQYGEEAAR